MEKISPTESGNAPGGYDCNIPDIKYIMTFLLVTGLRVRAAKKVLRNTMIEIAMTETGEEPSR
jgi:hypothetical protein